MPLPAKYQAQIDAIRLEQLRGLERALAAYDRDLSRAVAVEIKRLQRAGYSTRALRLAVNRLLRLGDTRTIRMAAEQVELARIAADREAEIYAAWERSTGALPAVRGASTAAAMAGRATSAGPTARTIGRPPPVATQASLAREMGAPLGGEAALKSTGEAITQAERYTIPPEKIRGFKIKQGPLNLSENLHGGVVTKNREVRQAISRVIREQTGLDKAGKDLITDFRATGGDVGRGSRTPKILERLQQHGRSLARLNAESTDPAELAKARRAWDAQYRRVEKYYQNLKDGRGGYRELLADLRDGRVQNLDTALEKWTGQKQRYYAERIIRTESSAAMRLREYEQNKRNPRIVGVIWRMMSSIHRRYASRTPAPKKGRHPGSRCVCEALNGQQFPVDAMRDYPRMGHPHCSCYWEPVIK